MPADARKDIYFPNQIGTYHCHSRCVQRAERKEELQQEDDGADEGGADGCDEYRAAGDV